MIITSSEYLQLYQLRDEFHTINAERGASGYVLNNVESNAWARREIMDWRARHRLDCECLRPSERVYLSYGA